MKWAFSGRNTFPDSNSGLTPISLSSLDFVGFTAIRPEISLFNVAMAAAPLALFSTSLVIACGCAAEKLRIVLLGMEPGVEVSDVCRREGLNPTMYYQWKRTLRGAADRQRTETGADLVLQTIPALDWDHDEQPASPEESAAHAAGLAMDRAAATAFALGDADRV